MFDYIWSKKQCRCRHTCHSHSLVSSMAGIKGKQREGGSERESSGEEQPCVPYQLHPLVTASPGGLCAGEECVHICG